MFSFASDAREDFALDKLAEVRASRTHRRPLRTTTGFEDREDHRNPSTSTQAAIEGCLLIAYYVSRRGVMDWPVDNNKGYPAGHRPPVVCFPRMATSATLLR